MNRNVFSARKGRLAHRRGAVAVEMALTLPLLLLVLFAIFEFGRANMIRHATEAAAYEGARVGILPGAQSEDARDAALRVLRSVGVDEFEIAISPNPIVSGTQQIQVDIHVPLDQNMTAARFFSGLEFTGTCRLSRELISDLQ